MKDLTRFRLQNLLVDMERSLMVRLTFQDDENAVIVVAGSALCVNGEYICREKLSGSMTQKDLALLNAKI